MSKGIMMGVRIKTFICNDVKVMDYSHHRNDFDIDYREMKMTKEDKLNGIYALQNHQIA